MWLFAREFGLKPWELDGESVAVWYLRWRHWLDVAARIAGAR